MIPYYSHFQHELSMLDNTFRFFTSRKEYGTNRLIASVLKDEKELCRPMWLK